MFKRSGYGTILVILTWISTAAAEPNPIVGRVCDEQGHPITGARVAVMGAKDGCDSPRELSVATTGVDGRFSFTGQLREQRGLILATKEGKCLDWAWQSSMRGAELVLRLGPATVIEGSIVDEAGRPIAGVAVDASIDRQTPYISPSLSDGILQTKTDSRGFFRFNNLPAQARVGFDMTAPGYARCMCVGEHDEGPFSPGQNGLRFVMPQEGRLEGTVVEKDTGKPLADLCVQVRDSKTTTDKNGGFRITGLTGGKYEVEIVGMGDALPQWIVWKKKRDELHGQTINIKAGQTTSGVKLEATQGGILEIVLTDAATGKTIASNNACITVCRASDIRMSNLGFAGKDGLTRLCLPPDKYVVTAVEARDYRYGRERRKPFQEPFQVEINKTNHVTIAVEALPRQVTATVRDSRGQGVPRPKIQIIPMVGPPRDVVGDDNGHFTIDKEDLFPFACFLFARHPKLNLSALAVAIQGEEPPQLTLRPPTTVVGIVLDPKRRPVAGAKVEAQIDASHMGRYGIVATTQTDKEGNYQLELPVPTIMSYVISARAPGFTAGEIVVAPNELLRSRVMSEEVAGRQQKEAETMSVFLDSLSQLVSAQKTVRMKELVLKTADRKVRGVVKDGRGNPVPGAIITATASPHRRFPESAVTDEKGRFTLEHLDDSSLIYVFANVPGRGWRGSVCPKPGETDVQIEVATPSWD
jgi:protocatechuate 3,4-dioxygenase beta subunit